MLNRWAVLRSLLALGAVAGFVGGFAEMAHCRMERREAFERHVSDVCVSAALRALPRGGHE